ncbi:hypothetical protein D3C72_1617460 [compost metagenome]
MRPRCDVKPHLVRQALTPAPRDLGLDETALRHPLCARAVDRTPGQHPRLPVAVSGPRLGIARVAPRPALGIARIDRHDIHIVPIRLPPRADFERPAPFVVGIVVAPRLPVPLELQGQPVAHAVLDKQRRRTVHAFRRQVRPTAGAELLVGPHVFVFHNRLPLPLGQVPRAGPGLRCDRKPRQTDQQPPDCSHTS